MASLKEAFPNYKDSADMPHASYISKIKKEQERRNAYEASVPISGHLVEPDPKEFYQTSTPRGYEPLDCTTLDQAINPQMTAPIADIYGFSMNPQLKENLKNKKIPKFPVPFNNTLQEPGVSSDQSTFPYNEPLSHLRNTGYTYSTKEKDRIWDPSTCCQDVLKHVSKCSKCKDPKGHLSKWMQYNRTVNLLVQLLFYFLLGLLLMLFVDKTK